MMTFTARVELHSANSTDYKHLLTEMQKEAFVSRSKQGQEGNVEFKSKTHESIREAIDAVLRAASKTGRKFSFTVMKDKNLEKLESRLRYAQHH